MSFQLQMVASDKETTSPLLLLEAPPQEYTSGKPDLAPPPLRTPSPATRGTVFIETLPSKPFTVGDVDTERDVRPPRRIPTEIHDPEARRCVAALEKQLRDVTLLYYAADNRAKEMEKKMDFSDATAARLRAENEVLRANVTKANDSIGDVLEKINQLFDFSNYQLEILKHVLELKENKRERGDFSVDEPTTKRQRFIKPPRPPKYNGVRDAQTIENFLYAMDVYQKGWFLETEEDKLAIIPGYLVDHARIWFSKHPKFLTYDEFQINLRKRFFPTNTKRTGFAKLLGLKCLNNDYHGYLRAFEHALLEAEESDIPDHVKLLFFINKLPIEAKLEMERADPHTYLEAITVLERLADILPQCTEEVKRGQKRRQLSR